jgi:tetratricopeptide (TPR) repeat protein
MLMDWEYVFLRTETISSGYSPKQISPVFAQFYRASRDAGWGHQFSDYQSAVRGLNRIEKKVQDLYEQEVWGSEYEDLRTLGMANLTKILRADDLPTGVEPSGVVGSNKTQEIAADLRTQAADWFASRTQLEPEEEGIFRRPNRGFAQALGIGFAKISQTKPLVVLLDTYEMVGPADAWVRMVLRHAGGRVIWVIAGRWDFQDRSETVNRQRFEQDFPADRLELIELDKLADGYMAPYLRDRAPARLVTRDSANQLYSLSQGIPLAMQLVANLWAGGVPMREIIGEAPEDADNHEMLAFLSQRLLEFCYDPRDRLALTLLALQPRPNEAIINDVVLPGKGPYELREQLRVLANRYPFVRVNGGAILHRTVAGFLSKSLLRRRVRLSEEVKTIANLAASVSLKARLRMEEDFPRLEDRFESEEWRRTMLEALYWTFIKNEFDAWRQISRDFVDALGYDLSLAEDVITIIEQIQPLLTKNGLQRLETLEAGLSMLTRKEEIDFTPGTERLDAELQFISEMERWLNRYGGKDDFAAERSAILDLRRGELYYRFGRFEEALRLFLKSEKNLPSRAGSLVRQLGDGFEKVGERLAWQREGKKILDVRASSNSETSLRKAIALGRRRATVYHALGAVQLQLGKSEVALENLLQAVTLNPDNPHAWKSLGDVYLKQNYIEKATPAFRRAVEQEPQNVEARLALAHSYRVQGKEDELKQEIARLRRLIGNKDAYLEACLEGVANNKARSLKLLELAVRENQVSLEMILDQPCFETLRQEPRYLEMVNNW